MTAFKENTDSSKVCIRKIMGSILIIVGTLIITAKTIYTMYHPNIDLHNGRGQFLIVNGVALLGLTSFDNKLKKG